MHNESADDINNAEKHKPSLIQQLRRDFDSKHIYPVHRLDKATSGLLICAKSPKANSQLSQLFQNRQVEKYYLALAEQKPKKKQGLIAGDMLRTRKGNWKLAKSNDNPAITQFFSYGSPEPGKRLFILKPYTGKTHQLRVALKSIGAPIVGDKRYAPKQEQPSRMHLHAYCLQFCYEGADYQFSCLPKGGYFTEAVLGFIQSELSEPSALPWPVLPDSLAAKAASRLVDNKRPVEAASQINGGPLIDALQCIVDIAEEPISEFQLIQTLNQQGWELSTDATDSLALFTSHFLVFNALYRLQNQYWQEQQRYLEITALSIYLHQPSSSKNDTSAVSSYQAEAALRDYYLDLSQLESATEESVNQLISQFWERYIATDESAEALQLFALEHPATQKQIKQRYRALAMEHHPDRGGKPEAFQKINWAFGVLQRAYQ